MKYLEDGVAKIDDAFYVIGRKERRFSQRKPVAELLKAAPENLPVILLDHRPTDLENVSNSRVDLQFSGHTHNGQLFPVNLLVMPFQYELAWGTMKKRNTFFKAAASVEPPCQDGR
jgi:predicted MPP superfamily phosphohydrolase